MAVPRPVDQGIKGQLRITVSSTAPTIRIAVASHVIGFAAPEPSDSWPDAWSGHEGLPQDRRPGPRSLRSWSSISTVQRCCR